MGFQNCPTCGASVEFALVNAPEPKEAGEERLAIEDNVSATQQVPEVKFSSLTDEEIFFGQFVIPESKPPEEEDVVKPVKKRSLKRKKKEESVTPPVEDDIEPVSDTEEVVYADVVTPEFVSEDVPSEEIISEVEEKVEIEPKHEPVKFTPAKSGLFDNFAAEAALNLKPENLSEKIDTTNATDFSETFRDCVLQPLETPEELKPVEKKPKKAPRKPLKKVGDKADTVPVQESKAAENKREAKSEGATPQVEKDHFRESAKKLKKEKEKYEYAREIKLVSLFGFLSIFVPLFLFPSNAYLNKLPKEITNKKAKAAKVLLNVLFYINLFCLVLGIISLTKVLALNYQALFAGNFAVLTGEFGKIAPLAIFRGFDFWRSVFSEDTVLWVKSIFDTYFSEFATALAQLENGFDIKIIFSLFGKIGIPVMILLASVGITGNFALKHKMRTIEKKLEKTYEIGNFKGETIRALKEQKINLTFKKKSFIKTIIVLLILTFILMEGYPIVSKILPLLDFIKEDIKNTK